ncbi:MAG: repressor LexA [Clostridiales bacterium]|nr:repressor LexA [Clostridiales bacterium]
MRTKNESLMQEIIACINNRFFTDNEIPSLQEIADKVGLSKGNVSKYLTDMEEKGLISRNGSFYGLSTVEINKAMVGIERLPVVGDVACGTPILAEENIESYVTISSKFLGTGKHFVLRAKGNSMINAGINDGDYVVIRQQETANQGQIVVALTEDGEATLKRYYLDGERKQIRLHPENNRMKDMYYDNIVIQGIAVKVIKDLEV